MGTQNCSGVNNNLQVNPLFVGGGDYHLQAASPALDHGPLVISEDPCKDLDGNPRHLDHDGDGLPQTDAGATEYHVYRGDLAMLSGDYGSCRDDLDEVRTDTSLIDSEMPAAGQGFIYLITADDGSGYEGTLGFTECSERVNNILSSCP